MSRRPNRGGGEQARALKAAADKAKGGGKGGRRGGHGGAGAAGASSDSTDSGGRYVPSSLSTASVGYAASATSSSSTVTFTPLSDTALAALAAAPAPANVYRQSVHGLPQAVEVSEEQLVSLRYAITATRVHDLTVQNQLMAGAIGGSGTGHRHRRCLQMHRLLSL